MSRKTVYSDEPMKTGRRVKDVLPPPEELAFKEESVKVTISLSKSSVEFFKREARKHNTPYQKMIRNLLDAYTEAHRD
ncbi:MAG TPA: CopG family transcriptional regulator [Gammaproteobacteria bacterium]|nr:CopG family transcriptional regulator [Gammaproteobacteria bacterium]